MLTLEQMAARLQALENWANREALKRGTYGFIAERMFAEHLASLSPEDCERILGDLTNPYRFAASVSGPRANDERLKRAVGEAASLQVEAVVESIRLRAAQLRQERDARVARPIAAAPAAEPGPSRD